MASPVHAAITTLAATTIEDEVRTVRSYLLGYIWRAGRRVARESREQGAGSREQGAGSGKWRCNRRVRLAQMGCAATHGRLSDSCHVKISLSGRVAASTS